MIRSKLRNKLNKSRICVNLQNYRKQRTKCIKVLRNSKQQYFNNLNSKSITGTRKFWKTMKPLFANKSKTSNTIIIQENNRIIKDNSKISHTLNKYFTNLTKTLKLKERSPALKKKSLKHVLRHFKNLSTKKLRNIVIAKKYLLFVNLKKLKP